MTDDWLYETVVFKSENAEAAQALRSELMDRFPFGAKGGPTQITGLSFGDAMSVSDAMRMALECEELDTYERIELALAMDDAGTWNGCRKVAAEWDLAIEHGRLIEAAIATEAGTAETGTGSVHEGADPKGIA